MAKLNWLILELYDVAFNWLAPCTKPVTIDLFALTLVQYFLVNRTPLIHSAFPLLFTLRVQGSFEEIVHH
jgi:hypothetical protein